MEELVENLVKTWETQASHFKNFSQWDTVDHDKYTVKTNNEEEMDGKIAYEIGNYNALMQTCPAYNKCKFCQVLFLTINFHAVGKLSFEESHDLFRGAFTLGFPWEVLRVQS